jgi:alpha-D-xyloside xylohydrolase
MFNMIKNLLHLNAKIKQSIALLFLITGCIAAIPANAIVKSFKKGADGVTFSSDKGLMKVLVRRADIVEVKYTIFDAFETKPSLVVNNSWKAPTAYQVAETKTEVIITTAKLKIRVNKATNAITYTDLKGNTITAEDSDNKTITPATVAGISTNTISTQFISPQNEGLFGLGCHPLDSLSINYKGRNQELLIKYLTGAIPVLLSTKGYGLLWDNYSASNFYGAEADNTKFKYVSESGKQVDYLFFYGPSFDHIIDLYRTATGRAPMFGKWAFGLFQSQDRYMSEDEIIGVKDN